VFAQEGAHAAVAGPQECVREMVAEDRRRRDLVVGRLNQMPGVRCATPDATIYAFPDFSALGIPSDQLARDLLMQTHVATESGAFYGANGEGHLRIGFGSEPYERIEMALDRFARFINER
jgi:aspartate aminotransferase